MKMKTRHAAGNLLLLVLCVLTVAVPVVGEETAKKKPPKVTYQDDVLPILRQKCFSCHDADKKKGDLDLTNYGNLMLGGGSGEVIETGDSASSYLYMLIAHETEPFMPPEQPKLPDEMIETIRKWIDGGVLETKSSKANLQKKKTFDLALQSAPTERPAVAPMPPRLSLEPVTRTQATTAVSAIATSPWSPLAAIASQQQVLLYNTRTLQLVGALPFPEGIPQVLKFSRNGSLLLAGGGQSGAAGTCIVWNIQTGERVFEVGDELDTVLAADISSDQTLIALGGPKRVVRIYSTESGRLLHELRKHTDWVCSIEFSPDSVLLATGDRGGGLYVWEGWTGREYLTLKAHSKCVTDVSWRSDSNVVASCSEDGSIRLWEMNNGGQIKNWGAHGGGVESIEFTRDGRIFSCGRDRVPRLWDQNGGKQRDFEAFGDLALEVGFCNETNRAIAGDWTGAVRIWNAADGTRIGELTPNPPKLTERLDGANKLVVAKAAEHKPLAAAYQVAQAAFDKAKTDLDAAQKAAEEAKKRLDTANTALNAAKKAATKGTQENDAAVKAVNAIAAGVPVLNEASTKAQEAAAKLPGDQEVADLTAKLKAVAAQRAAQLATNKKTAEEKAKALETAKATLAAADKEVKDSDAAYKAGVANVEKLKPLAKAAEEKANAAKQAADTAAGALAAAQNAVQRWQDEIAFAKQLAELAGRLKAANDQAAAAAEQVGELQQEVAQSLQAGAVAKQAVEAAQQGKTQMAAKLAAAAEALQKAQAAVSSNQSQLQTATNGIKTLKTALVPLNDAAAKTLEASQKVSEDKELKQAAATLRALADKKATELKATEAKSVQLTAAKKDLAAKAASAQKTQQQAQAALAAAEKDLAAKTAARQATELKVAASQKSLKDGQGALAKQDQAVEQVRSEIQAARTKPRPGVEAQAAK